MESLDTIADHVAWAHQRLLDSQAHFGHGCNNARDEAIWAALHTAKLMDYDYERVADWKLTEPNKESLRTLIETRIKLQKPLAYLIQEAWFGGLKFYVDERVIVPRSHLGDLIQDGLEPWINLGDIRSSLDLCTGSGCIAIALARQCADMQIHASDIDESALTVAQINLDRFQLNSRIKLFHSDLFEVLTNYRYDLIVCNPPYVDESELKNLPAEYHHEPQQALVSADQGLALAKKILVQAPNHLHQHAYLVMELGNSAEILEQAYPNVPFLWLTSRSGDSAVLLISAAELRQYAEVFTS